MFCLCTHSWWKCHVCKVLSWQLNNLCIRTVMHQSTPPAQRCGLYAQVGVRHGGSNDTYITVHVVDLHRGSMRQKNQVMSALALAPRLKAKRTRRIFRVMTLTDVKIFSDVKLQKLGLAVMCVIVSKSKKREIDIPAWLVCVKKAIYASHCTLETHKQTRYRSWWTGGRTSSYIIILVSLPCCPSKS